jgi:ribosomal protein S13
MEIPNNLAHQIALSLIPGIGSVTARNLIAYVGSVEGVFREKEKNLIKIPGVGEINAQKIIQQNVLERAKREVDFILKHQIQTLFYLAHHSLLYGKCKFESTAHHFRSWNAECHQLRKGNL